MRFICMGLLAVAVLGMTAEGLDGALAACDITPDVAVYRVPMAPCFPKLQRSPRTY